VTKGVRLWGRFATFGGLLTRLPKLAKRAVQRRLPTGAQDAILPHNFRSSVTVFCEHQ